MEVLKLLFAFSPWIAFWIISSAGSMFWLKIGIVVAALMVLVMGVLRLHRGVILWAGVAFFAFALVAAVWLESLWVIQRMGLIAGGTLLGATLFTLFIGKPFTEDYAREHAPREVWSTPAFKRACFISTGIWACVFAANFGLNVVKFYTVEHNPWIFRAIEFGVMFSGVLGSTTYAKHARSKRAEAAGK
jgi:hypothetical protein